MKRLDELTLKPIGFIESPFKQKFGTPRQSALADSVHARLVFDSVNLPFGSLDGLEECSHIWVIFWFHQNRPGNTSGHVKPPRLEGEKIGVLATRSPHHPNPVGLSLCKIISIDTESKSIEIEGVDMIDGTPILDIKPYVQVYDSMEKSTDPWSTLENPKINVTYSEEALSVFGKIEQKEYLMILIEKSLSQDIRNHEDKTKNKSDKLYRTRILDFDIHFTFAEDIAHVVTILVL